MFFFVFNLANNHYKKKTKTNKINKIQSKHIDSEKIEQIIKKWEYSKLLSEKASLNEKSGFCFMKGFYYFQIKNDFNNAEKWFLESLKYRCRSISTHKILYQLCLKQGFKDKAEYYKTEAMKINKQSTILIFATLEKNNDV